MSNGMGHFGAAACGKATGCLEQVSTGQTAGEERRRPNIDKTARFFFLADFYEHSEPATSRLIAADSVLVLDGCPAGHGTNAMVDDGLTGYTHLVLTALGIQGSEVVRWERASLDCALAVCGKILSNGPMAPCDANAGQEMEYGANT